MALAQSDMRRVGVLMNTGEESELGRKRLGIFLEKLREAGWIEGRNLRVETRWGAGDVALFQKYATELTSLTSDVILAQTTPTVTPLQRASRTIPMCLPVSLIRSAPEWWQASRTPKAMLPDSSHSNMLLLQNGSSFSPR